MSKVADEANLYGINFKFNFQLDCCQVLRDRKVYESWRRKLYDFKFVNLSILVLIDDCTFFSGKGKAVGKIGRRI